MAKTGDRARAFLEDLDQRSRKPHSRASKTSCSRFGASSRATPRRRSQPWDVGYYAEKQRVQRYDFDEEALRPYFSARARVVADCSTSCSACTAFAIEPCRALPVWHESVRALPNRSTSDGSELGVFYADLYPARAEARRRVDERAS